MDSEDRIHIYINHIKVKWLKIHGYLPIDKLVRPRLFLGPRRCSRGHSPQSSGGKWIAVARSCGLMIHEIQLLKEDQTVAVKRGIGFFMFFLGNLGDNNGKDFPKRFDLRILFGNR